VITPTEFVPKRIRMYFIEDPDSPNPDDNGAESVSVLGNNNFAGSYSAAFTGVNQANHDNGGAEVTSGGDAAYAGDFYRYSNRTGGQARTPGQGVGVQGLATGDQDGVGASGCGFSTVPKVEMIGVAGVANCGDGGKAVGVYASVCRQDEVTKRVKRENACLLIDNRSTKEPLILGRKENGRHIFQVDGEGAVMTAPPIGYQPALLRWGLGTGDALFVQLPNGTVRQVKFV